MTKRSWHSKNNEREGLNDKTKTNLSFYRQKQKEKTNSNEQDTTLTEAQS